jgi:hypothetical protein
VLAPSVVLGKALPDVESRRLGDVLTHQEAAEGTDIVGVLPVLDHVTVPEAPQPAERHGHIAPAQIHRQGADDGAEVVVGLDALDIHDKRIFGQADGFQFLGDDVLPADVPGLHARDVAFGDMQEDIVVDVFSDAPQIRVDRAQGLDVRRRRNVRYGGSSGEIALWRSTFRTQWLETARVDGRSDGDHVGRAQMDIGGTHVLLKVADRRRAGNQHGGR